MHHIGASEDTNGTNVHGVRATCHLDVLKLLHRVWYINHTYLGSVLWFYLAGALARAALSCTRGIAEVQSVAATVNAVPL